jgi:CRP-like cAMP-binding protein
MYEIRKIPFDTASFLATVDVGSIVRLKPKQSFFSQRSSAESVYYLRAGRAKLTVASNRGKEATMTLIAAGDFFGEESMAGTDAVRIATASAVSTCVALKIARERMIQILHEEDAFSDYFLKFIVLRGIKTQADLIDQLFNSSEKRLARTLLLMAGLGRPGERNTLLPPITQTILAEMIGTTRSRVSFFMNRFRKMGYIDYSDRIRVNKELLHAVLRDQLPEQNASKPMLEYLECPAEVETGTKPAGASRVRKTLPRS